MEKKSTTCQITAFLSAAGFLFSASTPNFRSHKSHDENNYRAVKLSCEMKHDTLSFSIFMSTRELKVDYSAIIIYLIN